jgi:ADP-ribose pyrophosphatase YjhB (NUDIX family)
VGADFETGELELYDFRTNPRRDQRQWSVSVIYIARMKNNKEKYWAPIKDVLLQEKDFGYDHHRIIQNYEHNC